MAKGFNLTAELNLRGPANLKKVVSDIRRQLGTVQANVNVNFSANAIKNSSALNKTLKDLNSTLRNTASSATTASQAINNLSKTFSTFNTVNSSASSVNNLTKSVSQLSSVSTSVAPQIGAARTEMQEFGKQSALAIRRFAAFTTVTSVVFGLTRSITQGVEAFIDFDKELTKIQAVTGETKAGLSDLVSSITSLSTGLGVSSKDLTNVSLTLAQAGFSASDTAKALKALALTDLAPTFDNLSQTVEGSIALLRQFNINAGDLEKALGSINEVSAKFAVESSDIIAAIQRAGGVFATASKGVSEGTDALNEFVAVFTSVRATTRESAETIATGLRTIFTRIQRGKTIEALKEFGVELTDAEGKFVGAFKAVQLLSEGLNKIDPRDIKFSQIVEELGGFRQIGKVIPLIQQLAVTQEALKVAQQGQDSLAADAVIAQTSLANQIAKTREQFLALFRDIGTTDTFQNITRGALGLASALISVADSIKGILPILAIIGSIKGISALTQFTSGFVGGLRSTGKADGGRIYGFNKGGVVPGSGKGDKVPAMLEPGEVVMSNNAVNKYGRGNLVRMNKYVGGGKVNITAQELKGRSRSSKAVENLITDDKDRVLYGSGRAINTLDNISFNRRIYKLYDEDSINNWSGFEEAVQKRVGGTRTNIGKNDPTFPIDIIGSNLGPLEVRNRSESTSNRTLLDKLIRYYISKPDFSKLQNRPTPDDISLGNIGVVYNSAKYDPPNAKELMTGGKIQKFMAGSPGGIRVASGKGRGAEGPRGARSKFKTLSETELAQLSTKDLIAYAKRQARDIFTTGGAGMAIASEFVEVPPERIIPELESELTTYLGKKGFWREKIAPFGSSPRARAGTERKMDSRTLRRMAATAGGVDVSALEGVSTESLLKYAEQAPRAPKEVLEKTIARYSNVSSIKPKFQEWGKNPSGGVFADVVSGFEDQIRNELEEPNKSRFDSLIKAGSLDSYKAMGGKDGHIPPLKKAIYEITGVTEKNIGGLIQKLNIGGKVQNFVNGSIGGVAAQALDPMLEKLIQDIANIGGTTDLYKFVSKPEIDDILSSKRLSPQPLAKDIVSSKWLRKQTPDRYGDRAQYAPALEEIVKRAKERFNEQQSGIQAQILRNLQASEGQAYQFGLASIYGPNGELGYSSVSNAQEIEGNNNQKYLTQIVRKSLPTRYESAIQATREDIAGLSQRAGERLQYTDIFGTGGPLAFDFDETLVKNADIFNEAGKIDILAYNNLDRVKEALKNAELTLLGQELQKRLIQYPELMDNIRVLTARPQSNAPFLANKLNQLGLSISESQITGVSGGLNKVNNLSDLETLIDDNIENIQSVLAGGKKGILYQESKRSDPANLSAQRGLAATEGYTLEDMVRNKIGIDINDDNDPLKPIDFPKGLGAYASMWDMPPTIPTDTKRTNSSTASSVMFDRAKKFYIDNFASGGFASGGTVPAMVSNGEAFVPPETAKKIGYAKLDKMNMADRNGMRGFSSGGGISVFKGSGSGTSDSIGPIGLPEGSYVIREKATKALGLKRGGAVKSFFFGGRSKKKDAVDETFEAIESFSPVSTQASKALDQAIESLLAKIVKNIADADPTISFDDALARAQRDTAAGSPGSANFALKQAAEAGDQSAAKAVANAQRQQVNAIIKEIRSIDKAVSISDAKAAAEKRVADAWGGLWKATNNATQATNKAAQAAGAAGASGSGASGSSDKSIESGIARFGKKLGDNTTLIFSSILPAIVGLYTKNIDVAASKSSATFAAALEGAVTGFSSSIALGGQLTSTVAGFSSDESTQNTINAFGGITSVVLGFGAAIAQSIISFKNAAIEFEKADAKKKLDVALDSVSKSFDELSKDIKNIDLQDAIIKKLQEAGDEAQRILTIQATTVRGSFATLLSGDLLGSGGPEAAQRSTILERSGTFAYIQSFNDEIRKVQFASLIPQIAAENSKLFAEVASNTNRIIEEKLRSGSSFDELIGSDNFKALARNIANADAEIQARILSIQSGDLSEQDKRARIESIQTIYAESEIRKRAAIIEAEKRVKEAEKSANLFSRSLERIFQNMEQSIGRTNFELDRMKESLDLVTASLTGQAKAGNSAITALNILANPRAYSEAERSSARTQASSLFVGNRNILTGLLTLGDNIEGRVLATINQVLRDNPAEANNEVIAAGIERAVRKDLADLQLPPDVSSKIANQVREGLVQLRKSEDEKIDFTDLVEKIPSLSKVVDSAKRAQEAAIKALESWQNSLNNYSSAINQLIDLQIETNNRLRQANKLLINSQIDLAKTLGKDISIATLTRARDVDIASRTGGATDPTAIFNRILQLENRRRGLQSAVDATANIGPSAVATKNFIQLNQSLKNNNVALRESYAALKELADNGELASAALNKVQEAQQKTAARANFLEKLVTSTPEELNNLNNAFFRLQRNLGGQTNSIQNSIGAQKAYFEALNNASSAFEAIQAAQQAFVNERKETLDVFNQILPFLGQGQQANEMRANVLQSMLAESGFAMTPMFQDMINAIRNPESDPETKAAIEEYRKVVALQSEANKALARLNERLAIDIADQSARTLSDALSKLKFTFETSELADIKNEVIEIRKLLSGDKPIPAVPRATGGIIYASAGQAIDFSPKGTDTVPAMLTPGEFVVNRRSTQRNLPLLQSINSGNYNNGGKVKYYSSGGYVTHISKNLDDSIRSTEELADVTGERIAYVTSPTNVVQSLPSAFGPISYRDDITLPLENFDSSNSFIGSSPIIAKDSNGFFRYLDSPTLPSFTPISFSPTKDSLLKKKFVNKKDIDSYVENFEQYLRIGTLGSIKLENFYPDTLTAVQSLNEVSRSGGGFWNPNAYYARGIGLYIPNTGYDFETGLGLDSYNKNIKMGRIFGARGSTRYVTNPGQAPIPVTEPDVGYFLSSLSKKPPDGYFTDPNLPIDASSGYKVAQSLSNVSSSPFPWLNTNDSISKFKETQSSNLESLKNTLNFIEKYRLGDDSIFSSSVDIAKNNEFQNKLKNLVKGSPYEAFDNSDKPFLDYAKLTRKNVTALYVLNNKYRNAVNNIADSGDDFDSSKLRGRSFLIGRPDGSLVDVFPWLINRDPTDVIKGFSIAKDKEDFDKKTQSGESLGFKFQTKNLSDNLTVGDYKLPYNITYGEYDGKFFDKTANKLEYARIKKFLVGYDGADSSIFNKKNSSSAVGSYGFDSLDKIKESMGVLKNDRKIKKYLDDLSGTPTDIRDIWLTPQNFLNKFNSAKDILGITDPAIDIFSSQSDGSSVDVTSWIIEAAKSAVALRGQEAAQAAAQVDPFGGDVALAQDQFRSLLSNLLDGSVKLFQGKPGLPGLGKKWLGSFNGIRNSLKRSRSDIGLDNLKQYSSQAGNIFGFVTGQAQNILSGLTNTSSRSQNNIADFVQELSILTSGASSVFGILSSGRTGFLNNFISGDTISGSLEDLFRTFGFNRLWTGIQGTKLGEGYKKSLENQLIGSKIRTVDSSGKITTKDFAETDLSDQQSVVDIAFNPYNEFPRNNIRQNLINDILSYVNSAVDKNGRKLFNDTTTNFLQNNISPLASRYLTQDLLFDVKAGQEAKNSALNKLKTKQPDYEHKILGFQDKFGPLPDASYFEKRLLATPQALSSGGTVYASNGTLVNFQPKGTDTVPAMLTPGEFVVNRAATQKNLPLLKSINSGVTSYNKGGIVYLQDGGLTDEEKRVKNLKIRYLNILSIPPDQRNQDQNDIVNQYLQENPEKAKLLAQNSLKSSYFNEMSKPVADRNQNVLDQYYEANPGKKELIDSNTAKAKEISTQNMLMRLAEDRLKLSKDEAPGSTVVYRKGEKLSQEEIAKIRGKELAEKLKWTIDENNVDNWMNQEPPEVIKLSQSDRDALYDHQWSVSDAIASTIRNKKMEAALAPVQQQLDNSKQELENFKTERELKDLEAQNKGYKNFDDMYQTQKRMRFEETDNYLKKLDEERKRRELEDKDAQKQGYRDSAQKAGVEGRIRFENAKKIQDQKIAEERRAREAENGPKFVNQALNMFYADDIFKQYRDIPNFTDNIINQIISKYESGKKAPLATDILSIARGASLSEGVDRVQAQSARIQWAQEKPFEAFAEELNKAAARRAERGSFIDSDNPLWKTLGYVGGVSEGIGNLAYGAANVVAGGAISIGGRAYQAGAYLAGSEAQQAAGAAFAQVGEEALAQGAYTAVELAQALGGSGPIQRGERSALAMGDDKRVEMSGDLGAYTRIAQNTGYIASQVAPALAGMGANSGSSLAGKSAQLFGGKLPIKINNPLFDDLKFANRGSRDFTKLSRGFNDIESISGADKLTPQLRKPSNVSEALTQPWSEAEAAQYLEILDNTLAFRKPTSIVAETARAPATSKSLTPALQTAEATIKKRGPLGDYESAIFKQVKDTEEAVKKSRVNLELTPKESSVIKGVDSSGVTARPQTYSAEVSAKPQVSAIVDPKLEAVAQRILRDEKNKFASTLSDTQRRKLALEIAEQRATKGDFTNIVREELAYADARLRLSTSDPNRKILRRQASRITKESKGIFTTEAKPIKQPKPTKKLGKRASSTKMFDRKSVDLQSSEDMVAAQSEFAEYLGQLTGLKEESVAALKKDFTPSKIVTGKEAAARIAASEEKAGREVGRASAMVLLKGNEAGTLFSKSPQMNSAKWAHEVAGHVLQTKNPGKLISSNSELLEASKNFIDSGAYSRMVGGRKSFYPAKGKISVSSIPDELFPEILRAAASDKYFAKNNPEAVNLLKKYLNNADYFKFGGMVYASSGTLVPYRPKGTDTVPAMLTPGEFVVNRKATKDNLGLLQNINKGGVVYASAGGMPGLTSQQEAGLENRSRLEEEKRRRREEIQSRRETYRYSQTLPVRERKEFMTNQQANASSFNTMAVPTPQNNVTQQQGVAPQQPLPDLQAQILASLVQLNTTATTISNNLNSTNQNITTPGISQNTTAENNNPSGAITISPEANEFLTQLTSSINNFGSYIDKLSGVFPESMEMNINFGELVVRIEGAAGLESLGNRVRDDVLSIVNNKISNMETLLNNLTGGEAPPPR